MRELMELAYPYAIVFVFVVIIAVILDAWIRHKTRSDK